MLCPPSAQLVLLITTYSILVSTMSLSNVTAATNTTNTTTMMDTTAMDTTTMMDTTTNTTTMDTTTTTGVNATTATTTKTLTKKKKKTSSGYRTVKHAVFGYGSESAAITNPTLSSNPFPCMIRGIERAWNKRSKKGMTAMGVQFTEEASCVGVLYRVTERELARFDRREIGYHRREIAVEDVDLVGYLDTQEHYEIEEHRIFIDAVAGKRSDVKVWVYVPTNPLPPDEEHPIAQTYVDVILQGCMEIHPDFAREFVQDTIGWNPQELLTDDDDGDSDEDGSDESDDEDDTPPSDVGESDTTDVIAWVNDRDKPIYMRADTEMSEAEGPSFDRFLRKHRPEFQRRIRIKKPKKTGASSRKPRSQLQMQFPTENF